MRVENVLTLLLCLAVVGCKKKEEEMTWSGPPPTIGTAAAPEPQSPDRLPPGKLLEGEEKVFEFAVPRGMTVHKVDTIATLRGSVDFDALAEYTKDRVDARHAEFVPGKLSYPSARIKGNLDGPFKIEIVANQFDCTLVIQDNTPPPSPPGLSEEQRWNRTGLRPGGGLVDRNRME